MSRSRPRLRDIAEATGFSANTVSLALRGSDRLPEATRQRIQEVAERLNYTPNVVAQSLKRARSHVIGLILTDVKNPVLTEVAKEVGDMLHQHGYATLFATSNNSLEQEREIIQTFIARQADGILVFPVHHNEVSHIAALRGRGYPVIAFAGNGESGMDIVGLDEVEGGRLAARRFLARGDAPVAMIDAAAAMGNTDKHTGLREELLRGGLAEGDIWHQEAKGHTAEYGRAAMAQLVAERGLPRGVFATSDSVALGVLKWCYENGVSCPDEVSLIGFDHTDIARDAVLPITSVAYPEHEVAKGTIERLLAVLDGDETAPASLVQRVSPAWAEGATAPLPGAS